MAIKVPIVTEYNSKGVSDAQRAMEKFGVKSSRELKKAAAGFAVLAVAGAAAFKSLDAGYDAIVAGTGATGDALEALKNDAQEVARTVPNSFEEVGVALAEVNTRLGLTGKPLQETTKRFLDLARVTKTDVKQNIADVTRVFGDWSVATEDQALTMDMLFAASQATGIGVDKLSQSVVQFGAPLRQMGFSLEESIALFGKFEKEGVNTEAIMSGMRQGLGRMAVAGEEPVETFQRLVEQIKNAGSTGEANAIALEAFGQRAGPDMAAAIREGRFELDDLVATLGDSEGALDTAAEATLSAQDRMGMLGNQLLVAAIPAIEMFAKVADAAVKVLTKLPKGLQSAIVALGVLAIVSKSARSGLKAFGIQAKTSAGSAGVLGAAAGVAGVAMLGMGLHAAKSAAQTKAAADAIDDLTRASDEQLVAAFGKALAENALSAGGLDKALEDIARTSPGVVARMLEMEDANGGLTAQFLAHGLSADEAAVQVDLLRAAHETEQAAIENATKSTEAGTAATDENTEATLEAADAALEDTAAKAAEEQASRNLKDRLDAQRQAQDDLTNAVLASANSDLAYRNSIASTADAIFAATVAVNDNEVSVADQEQAVRDAEGAILNQAAAAVRLAEDTAASSGATLTAEESARIYQTELANLSAGLDPGSALAQNIQSHVDRLNNIPRSITTTVSLVTHGVSGPTTSQNVASHVGSRFAAGETKQVVPGQVFTPDRPGRLASVEDSRRMTDPAAGAGKQFVFNFDGANFYGSPPDEWVSAVMAEGARMSGELL